MTLGQTAVRILIVDDEAAIRQCIHASLAAHGYAVSDASTGGQALEAVSTLAPDLIVLDLGLPDLDGKEVIRRLREQTRAPVVVLTMREADSEKILALEAGADDYITKPFRPGELLARIRGALNSARQDPSDLRFSQGDLAVDLAHQEVRVGGREVKLTPIEFCVLKVLVLNAGRALTQRRLAAEVWNGTAYEEALHLLRLTIGNLRRKLEADPSRPRYVVTEPGVGYRLRIAG